MERIFQENRSTNTYILDYIGLLCKRKSWAFHSSDLYRSMGLKTVCPLITFHWSSPYIGDYAFACRAMCMVTFYLVDEKRIVSSLNDNETISSLRVRRILCSVRSVSCRSLAESYDGCNSGTRFDSNAN